MRAGKLRRKATLQRPRANDNRNAVGEVATDWPNVAELWCAIEPLTSRESLVAQQALSTVTHTVTIRYRTGVKAGYRFKYTDNGVDRYLYIDGTPTSPGELREVLICTAQERGK